VKTILLVEDKRGMRTMLTTALEEDGWSVTAVADGDTAVEHLMKRRYDAVLTDVCIPGRNNGIDVLAKTPAGTSVVVMTAFGTIDMAVDAMKRGAVDFISKPFKLDELLEKLVHASSDHQAAMLGESSSVYSEGRKSSTQRNEHSDSRRKRNRERASCKKNTPAKRKSRRSVYSS
jgi:DNA-binding NtrC family response regulator